MSTISPPNGDVQVGQPLHPSVVSSIPQSVPADPRMQQFRSLVSTYEISDDVALDLRALEKYRIVMIVDDSGSMGSKLQPTSPYAPTKTRWDELKDTASTVAEIAILLSVTQSIDLYFLNNGPHLGLTDTAAVAAVFNRYSPGGPTPLADTLRAVLATIVPDTPPCLILIATDGAPTGRWGVDVRGFANLVMNRAAPERSPIGFLACTDDDTEVAYLDDLDRDAPRVDTTDDYASERAQVLALNGKILSRGDWVCKALLGPIMDKYDKVDESAGAARGARVSSQKTDNPAAFIFAVVVLLVLYLIGRLK